MLPFQQLIVIGFEKYVENLGWNKVREHFCVEKPSWSLDDNFLHRLDDFLMQIPEKQKLRAVMYFFLTINLLKNLSHSSWNPNMSNCFPSFPRRECYRLVLGFRPFILLTLPNLHTLISIKTIPEEHFFPFCPRKYMFFCSLHQHLVVTTSTVASPHHIPSY